jgi:hypothetical protein
MKKMLAWVSVSLDRASRSLCGERPQSHFADLARRWRRVAEQPGLCVVKAGRFVPVVQDRSGCEAVFANPAPNGGSNFQDDTQLQATQLFRVIAVWETRFSR